jgi:hypothetical protein
VGLALAWTKHCFKKQREGKRLLNTFDTAVVFWLLVAWCVLQPSFNKLHLLWVAFLVTAISPRLSGGRAVYKVLPSGLYFPPSLPVLLIFIGSLVYWLTP